MKILPRLSLPLVAALSVAASALWTPATAQVTAYKQAIAEAAFGDDAVAAFYRGNGYQPIWTGDDAASRARRAALISALRGAGLQGLPAARYQTDALLQQLSAVRTTRDLGMAEVALSHAFVQYATDLKSGLLEPASVDKDIDRKPVRPDAAALLTDLSDTSPADYFRSLAPSSQEYRRLLKEKLLLEELIAAGGWGATVPAGKLEPGDSGPAVVALRDRLVRMGYLQRSASGVYDKALEGAVRRFQARHGLEPDGVAGKGTVAEVNVSAIDRWKSVVVALERERWLGDVRTGKYVLVNQPDFTAKMIEDGAVTFRTRAVIGKNASDRRSPEFSDEMEYMVINPSWYVPRSIMVKEYLPKLQRNPNAVSHLVITDVRGQQVDRSQMDFTQFSTRNFPFDMRQPPSKRNALGLVKFMLPNRHNIYLHDTPEKNLFGYEKRDFSHGCIRLARPFDFAYKVLSAQEADPVGYFQSVLKTGQETQVDLVRHIPVHIIYRTAFATPKGGVEFRRDVYGRDAKIWKALQQAGLALPGVQG